MHVKQMMGRMAAGATVGVAALSLAAGPAFASAQTFKDHESFPAAGAVFTCTGGDISVTGGTVYNSIEGTQDSTGAFHITGTITVHDITATDGNGGQYTITGASWFGGRAATPDGSGLSVSTDTADFVIHNATGGVYAKVQMVEHISPNGKMFSFDFGSCQEPQT
ncbi:MAG TPA: hypothetical protein VFH70_12600 [Acidimicrobiales bacterium]|nr:hypothetical protein [Acidimicrobiales bacterium]